MRAKLTAVILVLVLVLAVAGIACGVGEIVAYEVKKHGIFTNTKAQMELLVSLGRPEDFKKLGELIERYEVGGGKGGFSFGSGGFGAAAKELYDAEELGLLGDGHEVKLIEGNQNDSVVRVAPVKNYANEKFFVRFVDLKPLTLEQTWQFKMDTIQKKTEQNRKQEQDAAEKAKALIPKKEDTTQGAPSTQKEMTREEIDAAVQRVQKQIDVLFKKNGGSK